MKVSLVVLGVLARSAHGLYEEQAGAEDWYVMLFYVLSAVAWCQHAAVLYFSGATLFSLVSLSSTIPLYMRTPISSRVINYIQSIKPWIRPPA